MNEVRLIDANALKEEFKKAYAGITFSLIECNDLIDSAPTVEPTKATIFNGDGYQEGYTTGYDHGYADGHNATSTVAPDENLLNLYYQKGYEEGYEKAHIHYKEGYEKAKKEFEKPKGEWIEGSNGNIKCNKCGAEIRYSYLANNEPDWPKFCCDCGAEMLNRDKRG